MNCFDFQIPLNAGLVSIIGNKGSGKSALSDIIGHLCKSKTMDHASFLNEERFRKRPKNFADDYKGIITWVDGHSEEDSLGNSEYESSIEDAQYLPQKYIEVACDAEQIIYCNMDKNSFSISYEAGAIEDSIIKNRVIDVLEGTMPAFDLRRKKYEN